MKRLRHFTLALACFMVVAITNDSTAAGVGIAGASSDQSQVQYSSGGAGGSGGSVAHSGNSAIGFNNSFNGAEPIRYLPVPTAVPMENYQPGVFGSADHQDKGPNFISMRQLVAAMNMVDLSVKVKGAKKLRMIVQKMSIVKSSAPSKGKINFEINDGKAVNHGFKPIATLSVETKVPDKSNSASLAIAIGKEARKLGATRVIFLTEGSSKQLKSSGWGIGFAYNYAEVDSSRSGNGSVGSGGTGYSQGKAGYRNLIYITAIVGT